MKETTQKIQQHTKWEIVVGGAGAARLAWQRQQLSNTHRGAGQQVVHVGQQPLVGGAAAHSGWGICQMQIWFHSAMPSVRIPFAKQQLSRQSLARRHKLLTDCAAITLL